MEDSLITVFEDRRTKVNLTGTQANDILAFQNILGKNRLNLSYDGVLHVMHYVGFISKGTTRLQILPKIYENTLLEGEEEQRGAMKALLNLLKVSEFNKVLELPEQMSSSSHADTLWRFSLPSLPTKFSRCIPGR